MPVSIGIDGGGGGPTASSTSDDDDFPSATAATLGDESENPKNSRCRKFLLLRFDGESVIKTTHSIASDKTRLPLSATQPTNAQLYVVHGRESNRRGSQMLLCCCSVRTILSQGLRGREERRRCRPWSAYSVHARIHSLTYAKPSMWWPAGDRECSACST